MGLADTDQATVGWKRYPTFREHGSTREVRCGRACGVVTYTLEFRYAVDYPRLQPTLVAKSVCPGHALVAQPESYNAVPRGACKRSNRGSDNARTHDC